MGLTLTKKAERELDESEVTEGGMGWSFFSFFRGLIHH